jgi:hypothetical protein
MNTTTTLRRSWTGWTPSGSSTRGGTAATPARPSRPAPRPGTCATSSCATPRCWTGSARDGPGRLDEADAWYFILEGTREPLVAEAQAMAITELAARAATTLDGEQRAILLAADDYSAVSRRVPMSNLYERWRSLGIGVQVSALT